LQRLAVLASIVAALLFAGIAIPDVRQAAGNFIVGHDAIKAAPGHANDGSNAIALAQSPQEQNCPDDGACCCPVSACSGVMLDVNIVTAFVSPMAARIMPEALSLPVPSGNKPPFHPPRAA